MRHHPANPDGRDFFVGDLHGEYDLLMEALAGVDFAPERDRLFSVGDLIDRGPRSRDCLALALAPWFFGVRGNHEAMAQAALAEGGDAMALWVINGGGWACREPRQELRGLLSSALRRLPYAREIEAAGRLIGLVHAEPPDDWGEIGDCDRHTLLWGRRRIRQGDATPVRGIDAVVVGHTILEAPTTLGNVHYLDTGAFASGRLTLVEATELLAGNDSPAGRGGRGE
ncbi:metallophosphoesterase [Halomonas beimenensis]|uniref:metallophosphoesterase n=1 Tax=Halomonas beimenensis TaxID=475662 RepID=UPI001D0E9C51|nr:metallophosphoesterase [Halomonas beimenensis]